MTHSETAYLGTLASLSETGQVPRKRVSSAQQVREMYNRARRDGDKRSKRNAIVAGLVDGNPPYSDDTLAASGQKYRSNFNNGEAESYLQVAQGAFYDLFSETEQYVTCDYPADVKQDPAWKEWSEITACEFDKLLREFEDDFDFNAQLCQSEMVLYGAGLMIPRDIYDFRYKAVKFKNWYLPKNAPAQVKYWPWFLLSFEIGVEELYEKISDPETAKRVGWNISEVKNAIIQAGQTFMSQTYPNMDWSRWETWQDQLRQNDLCVSDVAPRVSILHLAYQEFSENGAPGKVSEVWVPYIPASSIDLGFLFESYSIYDTMEQAASPFFYDRGTGTAHSVRGLGVKMSRLLLTKTRLQNAAVDSAFAKMATMFQAESNDATLAPVHLGPYTLVPAGISFVANTSAPGALDAPMAVARDLDNTLAANLSQYRQRVEGQKSGNPRTAYEVSADVHQASLLNKTQIARYYCQLDAWYAESYRRASYTKIPKGTKNQGYEAALDFQSKLRKLGVPEKVWDKTIIKAFRVVGQGSAMVRTQQLQEVFGGLYNELPEDGRQRLLRDIVSSKLGYAAVSRYLPDRKDWAMEQEQRWEAQLEDGVLRQGGQVQLAPGQNDMIHLDEHLKFASGAAQSLQQGAPPEEVYKTVEATGSHMVLHLQRLAKSPQRQQVAKLFEEQIRKLGQLTDQLGKQIQEQQQAAAEAQQQQPQQGGVVQDPKLLAELQAFQMKMQMDAAKAKQGMEIKDAQAAQGMKIQALQAQQDLAIQDAKSAADVRRILGATMRKTVATPTE